MADEKADEVAARETAAEEDAEEELLLCGGTAEQLGAEQLGTAPHASGQDIAAENAAAGTAASAEHAANEDASVAVSMPPASLIVDGEGRCSPEAPLARVTKTVTATPCTCSRGRQGASAARSPSVRTHQTKCTRRCIRLAPLPPDFRAGSHAVTPVPPASSSSEGSSSWPFPLPRLPPLPSVQLPPPNGYGPSTSTSKGIAAGWHAASATRARAQSPARPEISTDRVVDGVLSTPPLAEVAAATDSGCDSLPSGSMRSDTHCPRGAGQPACASAATLGTRRSARPTVLRCPEVVVRAGCRRRTPSPIGRARH